MQKILYISQLTNMSGKLHKSVASAVDTGLTKGKVNAFVFKVKKYISNKYIYIYIYIYIYT